MNSQKMSNEDEKFFVNTSCITKRSLLPFIKNYSHISKKLSWHLPHSRKYPYANIYYSFGEYTNPFTRIKEFEKSNCNEQIFEPHFSLPKIPFLEQDPYSENGAKINYLQTPPVCFVIFGKPNLNSHKLAQMIAKSWKCILISAETVIQELIEKNSPLGQQISNILKSNGIIEQEIIEKLIEERVNQQDVKHRGYILEGWPLISNYCHENRINEKNKKIDQDSLNNLNKMKSNEPCEYYISRQIKNVFNLWSLKPKIIIYMVCPVLDFNYKRNNSISNSHKDETFEIFERYALPTIDKILLNHNPQNVIRVNGQLSIEEMFQRISIKLRFLPLPTVLVPVKLINSVAITENENSNEEETSNEEFSEKKILEEEISLENISHYLSWRNYEGKTKKEIFEILFNKETISSEFRWKLSDWKFYCPVELAKGRRIEGNLNNALQFMNCIYFLSSLEAENSFIENPRPYLLPPNPMSSCKIAIIGPRYSGKSELCKKLSIHLGGTIIDIQQVANKINENEEEMKISPQNKVKIISQLIETVPSIFIGEICRDGG